MKKTATKRPKKKSQAMKNSALIVLSALLGAYSSKLLEILDQKFPYPLGWAILFASGIFMMLFVYFIWYDFVN